MKNPHQSPQGSKCDISGVADCIETSCQCHQASEHIYCTRNNLLEVPHSVSADITNHTENMKCDINTSCAVDVNCMTIDKRRKSFKKQRTAIISKLTSEGLFIPDKISRKSIISYKGTTMRSPNKAKVKFISAEEAATLASSSAAKRPSPKQGAPFEVFFL